MSPGVLPVWLPMASPMAAGGAGCGRPLAVRLDPSSRSPLSPTVPSNSAQQNGATGGGDKDEQTVVDSHGGRRRPAHAAPQATDRPIPQGRTTSPSTDECAASQPL